MNNLRLPKLTYFEPRTIDELMTIKKELAEKCAILAGGTDLIPMLKRRNISARHVVNIKKIPGLNDIYYNDEKRIWIGPALSLRKLIDHPLISKYYPLLATAAGSVAFNQVRNTGTIGGNICLDNKCTYYNQSDFWWQSRPGCFKRGGNTCYVVKGGEQCFALSAADTVSALIALEAELIITGPGGDHSTPLETFYTGDGKNPYRLNGNEVVTGIVIPPPTQGWREGFLKKSHRGSMDFPIVGLSIRLKKNDGGVLESVRIALNGISLKPIRAREVEGYLVGRSMSSETLKEALQLLWRETTPLSMIGSSAFYRRKIIEVFFIDLIKKISK